MDYAEAITKAWKIIWRFKILWLLGLLSSCSGGPTIVPAFNFSLAPGDVPFIGRGSLALTIVRYFESVPAWVWFAMFGVIFLVGLTFFVISLVGRAGIKRAALLADEGGEKLPLGELLNASFGYFWRMLGVTVLVGLPGFIFVVINLALFAGSIFSALVDRAFNGGILLLCVALPLLCLALPLSWLLSMLSELCTSALVAENLGVVDSIRRGWKLFWKKPGSAILVSLFLFVIQFVIGILMSLPVAAVIFPIVLGGIVTGLGGGLVIGVLMAILFLVGFGLFVSSLLHAYSGSLWMLTFKRLTTQPATAAAVASAQS
jgi:hypothetical protein